MGISTRFVDVGTNRDIQIESECLSRWCIITMINFLHIIHCPDLI
jgi:hypothetical protein